MWRISPYEGDVDPIKVREITLKMLEIGKLLIIKHIIN